MRSHADQFLVAVGIPRLTLDQVITVSSRQLQSMLELLLEPQLQSPWLSLELFLVAIFILNVKVINNINK